MSYSRVKETSYLNNLVSITAIPDHYVALPAVIAATNATDGVIKAGTCVTNANTATGRASLTPCATGSTTFNGVIMNDVEVFGGETNVNVTVLVHGFVRQGALQKVGDAYPTSSTDLILVM